MKNFLRCCLFLAFVAASAFAQGAGRIGDVNVTINNAIKVRVSASTEELNRAALTAFGAHGAYQVVASGFAWDIRFAAAGPTQVRVDVMKGGSPTPVASQTVNGSTLRAALLRAADIAVEQTNGLGLKGFFSARLAFVGESTGKKEVYVSDLFFSPGEVKRLTNDRSSVLTPRWSPDGQRLIFTSYFKNGFPDIFEYDLRSYVRTTFVSLRGSNLSARYSPNGRAVAMVLSGEGSSEIYVSDAQGKQISRKTRSEAVKASPAWSPDSSRLVFTMEPGPQLHVMSAGGGGTQRLVTGSTYAAEPDWSRANPNKIACTVRSGSSYQIAVYDVAAGKAAVVSKARFDGIEPCWLGDGRHLVYTARDRSTSVLCILDTETGKSTAISGGFGGPALQANVWNP
jgi:TolB protein